MKTTPFFVLAALLVATPSGADVFSSQSFSGGTTTLDQLPGVNLDVVPGMNGGAGDCTEEILPAYTTQGTLGETRGTTCRFGNFSITTTGSPGARNHLDTTYGGNPPPWLQGWRP